MAAEHATSSNDEPNSRRGSRGDPELRRIIESDPTLRENFLPRRPRVPTSCCICINRRPGDNPAPDCLADFHMVDYG